MLDLFIFQISTLFKKLDCCNRNNELYNILKKSCIVPYCVITIKINVSFLFSKELWFYLFPNPIL